ncbi:DNA-3-methyladenine glycosylase 1 [Defluviimonas aquaemixtae]|uniref:DNA-3-methyladenine glycosylase 1 n=1 Tax=Albidovulum aquaemixtae TaxID=1542388 RepID=A0A2R8BLU4_9RHOB|nr:DNA-3-methyladenine glycosylase I [Defluviimonas aquaemixtae]SPH24385.1 DNA-3-methyladenine glycosylase 1 [Defluviimonas aquaemixtae]
MRSFTEIYAIAAKRKGAAAVEARLTKPLAPEEIVQTTDDRWLSTMAKSIFQAGFNWKVIEAKWDGFESAFEGFEPSRVALYGDAELDRLLADKGVVRNGAKLSAVISNAVFLTDLAREYGTAARFFADWPDKDYVGLLDLLSKRGSRLGGATGQRVLRVMGKPAFVLSKDVTARLIAEGVVDKAPTSKRDLAAVQSAFNAWNRQSGRSLTEISQVLAMSIGD